MYQSIYARGGSYRIKGEGFLFFGKLRKKKKKNPRFHPRNILNLGLSFVIFKTLSFSNNGNLLYPLKIHKGSLTWKENQTLELLQTLVPLLFTPTKQIIYLFTCGSLVHRIRDLGLKPRLLNALSPFPPLLNGSVQMGGPFSCLK